MAEVVVYTFGVGEEADSPTNWGVYNYDEAVEHARENGYVVVANRYEWLGTEVLAVADFRVWDDEGDYENDDYADEGDSGGGYYEQSAPGSLLQEVLDDSGDSW